MLGELRNRLGQRGGYAGLLGAVMLLAVGLMAAGMVTNGWLSSRMVHQRKEYLKAYYAIDAVATQVGQEQVSGAGLSRRTGVDSLRVGEYEVVYSVSADTSAGLVLDAIASSTAGGPGQKVRMRRRLTGHAQAVEGRVAGFVWLPDAGRDGGRKAGQWSGGVREAGGMGKVLD